MLWALLTTASGCAGFKWVSDTTHTSISLFRISASKATGARTLFLVFDRLHMFTNMQLGTAKSEGLFFLFTGALCNAVRHLLAFSSLTGQDFTGRRDFTTSMAWPSLALSLGFKKASAALFLTLLRPLYLKIPSCQLGILRYRGRSIQHGSLRFQREPS